jgi:hypothetical protein
LCGVVVHLCVAHQCAAMIDEIMIGRAVPPERLPSSHVLLE